MPFKIMTLRPNKSVKPGSTILELSKYNARAIADQSVSKSSIQKIIRGCGISCNNIKKEIEPIRPLDNTKIIILPVVLTTFQSIISHKINRGINGKKRPKKNEPNVIQYAIILFFVFFEKTVGIKFNKNRSVDSIKKKNTLRIISEFSTRSL